MAKGKFFVFEGIDGSGKSTQVKLLAENLQQKGYGIERLHFPQHEEKSAGLVDEYLSGKYGEADEVGPYVASVFYACDRYDASFKIRKWLDEGKIVLSDRYLVSNVGHQGGKIKDKGAWEKYVAWLYDLEYSIFKIPKPDYTFVLKTSHDMAFNLVGRLTDNERRDKKESYLSGKKDIHERNAGHLADALRSYMWVAEHFPEEFKVVECMGDKGMLPPEEIHRKVLKLVEEKI